MLPEDVNEVRRINHIQVFLSQNDLSNSDFQESKIDKLDLLDPLNKELQDHFMNI